MANVGGAAGGGGAGAGGAGAEVREREVLKVDPPTPVHILN